MRNRHKKRYESAARIARADDVRLLFQSSASRPFPVFPHQSLYIIPLKRIIIYTEFVNYRAMKNRPLNESGIMSVIHGYGFYLLLDERLVVNIGGDRSDLVHDVHALCHAAEGGVLTVEVS